MSIDYDDVRSANSPDGLIGLLRKLGHEPELNWDGCADVISVLLDGGQPKSVRNVLNDAADTVRSVTSLSGETRGIECYVAILNPGQKLIGANTRNLSHAFRHVSHTTRRDETLLFIGRTPEDHVGEIVGDTRTVEWATIRLERVYRGASKSEELRLTRLDWNPTKVTRHTLDCISSLAVDALPGQVVDEEVGRFRKEVSKWLNKERLSQLFFRQFYRRFENALDHFQLHAEAEGYDQFAPGLKKEFTKYTKNDRKNDSNREEAAKYLLKQVLRILFLHFLQEKEWLCRDRNFMLSRWRSYEHSTRSIANYDATRSTGFHEQVLIPLFFETLNRRRPDDSLTNWGPTNWDKGDREGMPYLNGGIFEVDPAERSHVHIEQTDNGQTVSPKILIPDSVFSGDRDYDPEVDNEILDESQVSLLAFLDDFHFTIAEDTPIDAAVALDPELMGKIFENLLVSRHSDGAYYTPRSIVRFQCKDTLARYLEEQLADLGPQFDYDWLLALFDLSCDFKDGEEPWNHELFTPIVADRIKQALMECKVLDPAVGSGAYLLGMMTEMLRLRQLCHMVRVKEFVDRGSTKFYEWKRDIIRNSLYGVDINPQAVSICHLRLWLAMIVDQDRNSSSSLPNLDFQITVGNSLRDSIGGHRIFVPPGQTGEATLWAYTGGADDEGPSEAPILARLKRMRELRDSYYDENSAPSERCAVSERVQTLRQEMMMEGLDQLERYDRNQMLKIKMSTTRRDKAKNEATASFLKARQRIEEGTFTSIFSFEAIFGDVFQREGRNGFDIVIGNPPYLEDDEEGGDYSDVQDSLGLGGNQLYGMFWAKSIQHLVREGGQVSYITSDALFTSKTHLELRMRILTQSEIEYCIKAGHWFFTFNNNWTCIMTATKCAKPDQTHPSVFYDISKLPPGENDCLENALELWDDVAVEEGDLFDSNASVESRIIDFGNQLCRIGRYRHQQGAILSLPWKPFFHTAVDMIQPLAHEEDERTVRGSIGVSEGFEGSASWKQSVPRWVYSSGDKDLDMCVLGDIATVASGITTGGDGYYLYSNSKPSLRDVPAEAVLSDSEVDSIRNDVDLRRRIRRHGINPSDFDQRTLVPYDKPTIMEEDNVLMFKHPERAFFIDWSKDSVSELRNFTIADNKRRRNPDYVGTTSENKKKGAQVRNDRLYFTEGIAYSQYGEKAPQFWPSHGTVFAKAACLINSENIPQNRLLCLLGSHPFRFIAKAFYGNMSNQTVGSLQETPAPLDFLIDSDMADELILRANREDFGQEADEYWKRVSTIVGEQYGYNEHMMDEVFVWLERTFSRPGDTITVAER